MGLLRRGGASSGTMRTSKVVLCLLIGAVAFLASVRFDVFEWIVAATRRFEAWQFDEILLVGMFVGAVLVVLRYRRSLRVSEERFREGENLFKTLINNAADAIYVVSFSGEILEANRRACEDLGYSRDELVGLFVEDIEVEFESFSDEWERLLSGETVTVVGAHRRKDGTTFPVEGRSTVFEVDGTKYFMSIARDVGERNEMVEDIRTKEVRSRAILDAIPDLVFRFHRDGEVLDVKAHEVGRLRIPPDVVGRNLKELLPEKLSTKILVGAEAAIRSGKTEEVEIELPFGEGELHFDVRIVASGEDEAVCFARDVTERRESEKRNRAVLRSVPDAVCRISRTGKYLDLWAGESRKLHLPREVVLDGDVRSILGDEIADEFMPLVEKAIWTGEIQTIEYSLSSPEGEFEIEARIVASGEDEAIYFARNVSERNRALRRLEKSESENRIILESIPDLVFRLSRDGEYLNLHASNADKLYAPPEDLLGRNIMAVLPSEVSREFMDHIPAALETGEMRVFEYWLSVPGGDLHFEARMVKSGDDEVTCFARDITEQNKAIEGLRRSEARNRAMIEAIPDLVIRFDGSGRYLDFHAHEDFELLVETGDFIGRTVEDVLPPDVAETMSHAITAALDAGETQRVELHVPISGGGDLHREARLVKSGDDEVTCFVRDIGERVEFESRITRLAYHDELTNLPNRAAFMEMLAEAVECEGRSAVVILSLRGFSKVNDSLGRETGDRLLALVARRLVEFFEGVGEAARFDGDEFAILVRGYEDLREILTLIEEGQRIYPNMPFMLDETEVFLRGSVGIAEADEADDAESVVRKASVALLEAKEDSDADYKIYDEDMGERAVARIHLERDLRLALEYGHLEVHYQPEVFLSSGRIYSLEALARWNHPEHGYISPAVFIPLAEESGLIMRLGEYVLEEACLRMRLWRERLPEAAPCSVSVNISAVQLRQRDLPRKISRVLRENGLEPEALQLEITESAAMEDLQSCRDIFAELRDLGVRVALDDFGTGYSSLSCLRRFPLDSLKVDRSFVSTLDDDPQMANVVGSIIELAHALELEVISEGIETPAQLSTLRRLGCDVGQGYHFSHPLPPEEAFDLLASWQTLDLLDGAG